MEKPRHPRHIVACLLLLCCGAPPPPAFTTADPINYPDETLPTLNLVGEHTYDHTFAADAWHISLVGLDADSNLYVLDQLAGFVVAFSPTGASWTIGTEGDGPGELRGPTAAAIAGDTLHVMSSTRITQFHLDGTPLLSSPLLHSELWIPRSLAVVQDGFVMIADRMWQRALLRFDGESALDTILIVPYPDLHQDPGESWYYPELGVTMPPPMALTTTGSAYVSEGSPYEISVWSPTGERIETRGTNPAPVPVGPVDQAAYGWLMDVAGNEGAADNRKAAAWRDFVEALVVDDKGNMLVNRRDLLADGFTTWDYLTSEWQAIGRLVVPWALSIERLNGCTVYGIQVDEFGAGGVVRYRLDPCPQTPTTND